MNYKDRLKAVTSFEQLFDLREELKAEEKSHGSNNDGKLDMDKIAKCQEINFWLNRVTRRIEILENQGEQLDQVGL